MIDDLEIVTDVTVIEPAAAQRALVASTTPSDLLRMAVEQGADLDRLERLMALQERWEANEARKAFTIAMTAFKSEPMEIFKRKKVGYETTKGDFVGYTHAELSDVTDVVGPAMARHSLSYRWDVKQEQGQVVVACIVTHIMGHSERVTMNAAPDASGKKNAIQQVASTLTYMQRYTLLAVTGMSTKGMDDDGESSTDKKQEARRAQWLEDQKANINDARNTGELRKTMEYAVGKAREENDQDAEDQLLAAHAIKIAKARPVTQHEGVAA